jgi:glycosyltransferase involved in cell wall biosynthesis
MVGAFIDNRISLQGNSLESCGVFVSPKGPIGFQRAQADGLESLVLRCTNPALFNPNNTSLLFWHASDVSGFYGKIRVLYTVFETDRLSAAEEKGIQNVDAVIVPTPWHLDVLRETYHYKKPAFHIPAGVSAIFGAGLARYKSPMVPKDFPDNGLIMSSVGKYEKRKGQREAIAALGILANEKGVPILLLANWINIFDPSWFNDVEGELAANGFIKQEKMNHNEMFEVYAKGRCNICVLQRPLHDAANVANFYKASDYLLHPAFAEGWGLPISEAGRCGIPVIAQRYGGMQTSVPAAGSIPLEGKMVVANDGKFFHGDRGQWSETTVESIVRAVDYASKHVRDEQWGQLSANSRAAVYRWQSVASNLKIILEAIH